MPMRNLLYVFVALLVLASCDKELDSPPRRTLPTGQVLTVAQLRGLFTGNAIKFRGDSSVYAVVTADEQNGNLYKNIYVQDHTGAIQLRLMNSGGLYQGDSIRIYLPGTVLSAYNGMLQLDSVDVDNNVVKQATLVHKEPRTVTIAELNAVYAPVWSHPLQGMLVRLHGVQFIASEAATATWGDAVGQSTVNRNIQDCANATVLVRNSGYANFAAQRLPTGKGTFVAVMGSFGTTAQLFVRNLNEIRLDSARCGGENLPIMAKDFEDLSISSGGWTQQNVLGNVAWTASSFGTDKFGKITNFSGGVNTACETWYISPSVNLSTATAPKLNFRTACNYTGANIEVLVSTDYTGGAPSTATWTTLNPTISAGAFAWAQSGDISLGSYLAPNFRVAFKYTGSASDGKTWEVDDIRIAEQ
jgi:hypothetical protein